MHDPCVHCPCILRKAVCSEFCTVYKAAVEADAKRKAENEINMYAYDAQTRKLHYRHMHRQKGW